MLLMFAYLFLMAFVFLWFGYGTALRRTEFTEEENKAIRDSCKTKNTGE